VEEPLAGEEFDASISLIRSYRLPRGWLCATSGSKVQRHLRRHFGSRHVARSGCQGSGWALIVASPSAVPVFLRRGLIGGKGGAVILLCRLDVEIAPPLRPAGPGRRPSR
jgi:hypothetical protein